MLYHFRDPSAPPITGTQVMGAILYVLLLAISVWATGESLSLNFTMPKFFSYLIGLGLALIAAAMLTIIRNGFHNRQISAVLGGMLVFLLVWGISLLTNAHSFFVKSSLQEIRKQELQAVSNQLELLSATTNTALSQSRNAYESEVSSLVTSLRRQILDQNNPGLGPRADSMIDALQELLEQPITPIAPNGNVATYRSNQELADGYSRYIMNDLLGVKLAEFEREQARILEVINDSAALQLKVDIEAAIDTFDAVAAADGLRLLNKAYGEQDRQYQFLQQAFEGPILNREIHFDLEPLPARPPSAELQKISSLPKFISDTGGYNQPNFIWAFLLALGVDLGAFMIFYFMVLPPKPEW